MLYTIPFLLIPLIPCRDIVYFYHSTLSYFFFFFIINYPARTLSNKDLNKVIDELIENERRDAADNQENALKRKVINDLAEYLDVKTHHNDNSNDATINEKAKRHFPGVFATGLRGKKEVNKKLAVKSSAAEKNKDTSMESINTAQKKKNTHKQLDEKVLEKLNDVLREIL